MFARVIKNMKLIISLLVFSSAIFAQCGAAGANGPVSAGVLATNASGCITAATANQVTAPKYVAGTGTAQAQVVTLSPAAPALVAGQTSFCFMPNAANTAAAPTIALNGLTATAVTKVPNNTALTANDLITTAPACVIYDGTQFELQNPQTASGGGGVTDSSYIYFPAATGAANYGAGAFISSGWVWDGTTISTTYSAGSLAGLRIANTGGTHYAYMTSRVPVGWTGTVNVLSHYILYPLSSGTGTGTHTYSFSCITPGTTSLGSTFPVFSGATAVNFNQTVIYVDNVDSVSYGGLTCSPGTLGSPTGALIVIQVVRASTGTATDDTVLLGFDVAMPHTVQ
jgi:hypothetical protein